MPRTINDIYSAIGQGINSEISTDWDKAWIDAEVFEDAVKFKGEYLSNDQIKFFEVPDEAFDDFEELQEITTENESNRWNRAKFTLTPDGNFSIDFSWDQKLADEIERLS